MNVKAWKSAALKLERKEQTMTNTKSTAHIHRKNIGWLEWHLSHCASLEKFANITTAVSITALFFALAVLCSCAAIFVSVSTLKALGAFLYLM